MDGGGLARLPLRPTAAQIFVYGLVVTIFVFVAKCRMALAVLALVNGVPGFIRGFRRYPIITTIFLLGVIGTFLNSLLVANTGEPVASIGPLTVRSGAIEATKNIFLRFFALAGVSFIYVTSISPREAIRSLEEELLLPVGVAFSIAFSLRLLSLAQDDLREIMSIRRMRGARRVPILPRDVESLVTPMLSIMFERARWVGIAVELRGFRLRRRRRARFVPTIGLLLLLSLLVVQFYAVHTCIGS